MFVGWFWAKILLTRDLNGVPLHLKSEKNESGWAPSAITIHDKGLSTVIDWRDKDAYGNKLSPKKRAEIYRLRKWQVRTRVHSSIDRNLAFAMSELDRLSSQLGLPRGVKEAAAVFYRKAIEKKLIRGRSIEAMIAASVYAACRTRKIPRTLDEIAKHSRINRKELGRCYRLILRELEITIPIASPIDFIPRFWGGITLIWAGAKASSDDINESKGIWSYCWERPHRSCCGLDLRCRHPRKRAANSARNC